MSESLEERSEPLSEDHEDQTVRAMQVCPNCSTELRDKSCKLMCPLCGFFLSCSDFY